MSKSMTPNITTMEIDRLNANRYVVSVHKYGFFLCRQGTARILLGSKVYRISRNHLCIYTPNTFLQILEKSQELQGILLEEDVDTYYPVISSIDIRQRLRIRNESCVEITDRQADRIVRLVEMMREEPATPDTANPSRCPIDLQAGYLRQLGYALCLLVLEAYFTNTPLQAMPQDKDDAVLNRFLISVYTHCHRQRTVRFYADEQHLSPYYFSSIIRERSGKTALEWIESTTMTFARQYLECTDMSIKEIANRLSFPDQSTFGRYFKHREGCTPSAYRGNRPTNRNI